MKEEIYIVSQKSGDGSFNKLVKSQEKWWYDEKDAIAWLKSQDEWFQIFNAVFRIVIDIDEVEKVYDGKTELMELYDLVKTHGLDGERMYTDLKKKIDDNSTNTNS